LVSYYPDVTLQPNQEEIFDVVEGNYLIQVWDSEKYLIDEVEYNITLPNKKSNYNLLRFDAAMDKKFVIVDINVIYKGGDLAEHMSKAMGTYSSSFKIEEVHDGKKPFFVNPNLESRTFIDLKKKLPKTVKYGEVVLGLFYFPTTYTNNDIYEKLPEVVSEKLVELF